VPPVSMPMMFLGDTARAVASSLLFAVRGARVHGRAALATG